MSKPGVTPSGQPSGPRKRRHSVSETIISAAQSLESKAARALLIVWDDLPSWRRDNAFLLTGYRATSNSYASSLHSLLYLHNESVNIWSHLLGAILFLLSGIFLRSVVLPRYPIASQADLVAFACFFGGAVACLGMSATYHAISNHSEEVARWGNKLDYSGIVFLIVGSYVPALYYGFFCRPTLMTIYLYTVSASTFHRSEGQRLISGIDIALGNGLHGGLLAGAFPYSGMATFPRSHVRRLRPLRRRARDSRLEHLQLRRVGAEDEPQLDHPPRSNVHLRSIPLHRASIARPP